MTLRPPFIIRLIQTFAVAMCVAAVGAAATAAERAAPPSSTAYHQRPEVQAFIGEMVERHGFLRVELQKLFRRVSFQRSIIKAISPPTDPTVRSWQNYRAIFVNAQRIEAGQRFINRHADALARAEAQFGVPQEIIVAIIGIETVYGRNMGSYRVIDALSTLAFDYPRRAEYFRSELEQYLLFARDAGMDVFSLRGSYAGAFGIPQFMPGSFRRFAVDFDGDAQPDLVHSAADAIGSVANFLKAHGWQPGGPVALAVQTEGEDFLKLVDGNVKPAYPVRDLVAAGVTPILSPPSSLPDDALCVLVELETPGQASEFRVALDNFYVITRYNRSSFYAAAVMDLASEIRAAATPRPQALAAPSSGAAEPVR